MTRPFYGERMKEIIIVYEYDYTDCDMVAVPDFVADNVEKYTQLFFRWLSKSKDEIPSDYYTINQNGDKILIAETDGFVEWLNKYVCPQEEKAFIVSQHGKYDDKYPMADF